MIKYKVNYDIETKLDREKWNNKIFESKNCGQFKIIGVYSQNKYKAKSYICEFLDTKFQIVTMCNDIKRGNVKDHYKPLVYNTGFSGDYKGALEKHRFYKTWVYMFHRVYNSDYLNRFPQYKDVIIDEKWHNFSYFISDVESIIGFDELIKHKDIKFELDKDILQHNNKIYSLKTCCFVPNKLNSFFINKQNTNISGFEGVGLTQDKYYRARVNKDGKSIFIGHFTNPLNAYIEYHKQKLNVLEYYLNNEFKWIDDRIKESMYKKLAIQFEETLNNNILRDEVIK